MNIEQFISPPNEYGEVSFFWWHGDDITKEKLSWILEQLKEKHICGLQINYCHGNQGGRQCGLTMESNPKPLSKEWWELVKWFVGECKAYDISVSLSDYTLGAPGQESYMDEVLSKHPEFIGQKLVYYKKGQDTEAHNTEEKITEQQKVEGTPLFENETCAIYITKVPYSANPMCKEFGEAVADEFYGAFERNLPGECGKGVNFFFSDELNFNIRGELWCDGFDQEFEQRKGYSILPKLNAIFEDIGDETPKIRLDYYDVIVLLSEEGYFKPIYDWHEKRGMIFGCDHGGRGRDVTEFGDYFRTMKWNQGPGNDQPRLASDIIKSKVSSSIAHLYKRPRTWLEGFYSSGWQTSSADVADATFRNMALGHNLLSLHGLYYSTHGSMWEWAPPCNHYHMPYWEEMGTFLECSKRLSYLLSQGVHRCDVAIIYPVAAMEVDVVQGNESVRVAFETATYLYTNGVDFDFIDFESIERAKIEQKKLCVSGEEYQTIVVPNMKAVRYDMMIKLADYVEAGGQVILLGTIPSESDHGGRNDEALQEVVARILNKAVVVAEPDTILPILDDHYERDLEVACPHPYHLHRIIDGKDYYMLYGVPKNTACSFRAIGVPILVNPWNATRYRIGEYHTKNNKTELEMMLTEKEVMLLYFETNQEKAEEIPLYSDSYDQEICLQGEWQCEIVPTLDNTYGDYRLPAYPGYLGAEGRECKYCITDGDCSEPEYDDSNWPSSFISYGTYYWIAQGEQDEEALVQLETPSEVFVPYRFSMKTGIQGDAGYQASFHGLKGKVTDEFLGMGTKEVTYAGSSSVYVGEGPYYIFTCVYLEEDSDVVFDMGDKKPDSVWIDHKKVAGSGVYLTAGIHYLLLYYKEAGRTHFLLQKGTSIPVFKQEIPLAMTWYQNPNIVTLDAMPKKEGTYCWYRLMAPPGMNALKLTCVGDAEVWADGEQMKNVQGLYIPTTVKKKSVVIAIRIKQQRGIYDTAAILEPIEFTCEQGILNVDCPLEEQGLKFYSGGIRYSKTVSVDVEKGTVRLNLGDIPATAQVVVNGEKVATLVAPPYQCDITKWVHQGENTIEVLVHNTLYQHMLTIPTNFNGEQKMGRLFWTRN